MCGCAVQTQHYSIWIYKQKKDTILNFDNCRKFLHFSILKTYVSYNIKYLFLDIREFKYILNEISDVCLFNFFFFNPDILSIVCNLFSKDRNIWSNQKKISVSLRIVLKNFEISERQQKKKKKESRFALIYKPVWQLYLFRIFVMSGNEL